MALLLYGSRIAADGGITWWFCTTAVSDLVSTDVGTSTDFRMTVMGSFCSQNNKSRCNALLL